MRIFLTTFILLYLTLINYAQKGIDGLIRAEKDFAAYSVKHGTKDAFLQFLDSAGVVFDNNKAVNGIESWNKKENRQGFLNWQPQFAEIANSNDFGYTTGPWTFQQSATDTIVARGQYTTVWHITKYGEWKFLIDLGSRNTPERQEQEVKKIETIKVNGDPTVITHVHPMVAAENNFIKLVATGKSKAYKKYLSKESILNHNGFAFAANPGDQQLVIKSTSPDILYTMEGWSLSSSGDIGFVYGTTILAGKTENYLRIWRHEKDGWKIALEVLRY
jgi:ketosteroid isomerase-like protein